MVGVGDMVEGNYREGRGEIELEKRGGRRRARNRENSERKRK